MNITTLSPTQLRKAADIQEKIQSLQGNSVNSWVTQVPLLLKPPQLNHARSTSSVLPPGPRCERLKRQDGRRSKAPLRKPNPDRNPGRSCLLPGLPTSGRLKRRDGVKPRPTKLFRSPRSREVLPGELRFLPLPRRGGLKRKRLAKADGSCRFLIGCRRPMRHGLASHHRRAGV